MDHPDHIALPAGRVAARWFLFLVFFHLLPVPWFLFVAGGLAPASFLFAIGVTGLFITDFDSLLMAVMFLAPALISGLVFVLLAYLLAAAICPSMIFNDRPQTAICGPSTSWAVNCWSPGRPASAKKACNG